MTPGETMAAATVSETVLVVDDEVLVRMVLAEYLRHCGYRVIEAVAAHEAIAVLEQPDLAVNVVLSAAGIGGGMDGFMLAQWLREHRRGVDIILAGNPRRAADAAANLCEHGPLMRRPYEPSAVVERIRRLMSAKRNAAS